VVLLAGTVAVAPSVTSPARAGQLSQVLQPTPPPDNPLDDLLPGNDDDDDDDGDNGGGLLPGTGGDDDDEADEPGDSIGTDDPADEPAGDGGSGGDGKGGGRRGNEDRNQQQLEQEIDEIVSSWTGTGHIAGSFSSAKLVVIAARLRALGMGQEEIMRAVYRPFIIGGEAAWTDTWGAPRFGPGPIVRTHEGQDVFCRYGDPVLAPEAGVVSYSDGGLGGISARVHTSTSSYYYLTHLSATNADKLPAGSSVQAGDIVGFCGNTGNAATTPPHVHFGWYVNGEARSPMRKLVGWLEAAEERVLGALTKAEREAIRRSDARTVQRLFGDSFAPDLSDLDPADEFMSLTEAIPGASALVMVGRVFQQALTEGIVAPEGGEYGAVFAEQGD
jgi:murein DD-endopeptidase MepM/ murein hydrolase activator NlpD